jgi:hypothetical protein
MLWYKAWLELRLRLLLAGGMACLVLWNMISKPKASYVAAAQHPETATFLEPALRTALAAHSPSFISAWLVLFYHMMPVLLSILGIAFASAGLKTQTTFANARESHPSMFFTLSLPVSRARLLWARMLAGFGAVVLLSIVMLSVSIVASGYSPGVETIPLLAGSITGATVFFAISGLLSVYLADLWQIYAGYAIYGLYMYLWSSFTIPPAFDFFRLMNGELYLTAGHLPVSTLLVSASLIAAFMYATLICMRRRQF